MFKEPNIYLQAMLTCKIQNIITMFCLSKTVLTQSRHVHLTKYEKMYFIFSTLC